MGKVLFCQACGKFVVTQQHCQLVQHLDWSKHTVTVVSLKDQPGRQYVIGETAATSCSSGASRFTTLATSMQKPCVCRYTTFSNKRYTHTDHPDESALQKNCPPKCHEDMWRIWVLGRKENVWAAKDENSENDECFALW